MTDTREALAPPLGQLAAEGFLKSLPYDVVFRAKQIVSHLLLPEGATVLDLECETGQLTAAMAALNPRLNFIGIDRNRQKILRAKNRFKGDGFDNLTFEIGDTSLLRRDPESVDGIVASRVLGDIYARNNYDDTKLADVLGQHFKLLKNDGLMLVYDFAMPDMDDYVQMEFPVPSRDMRAFRLFGTALNRTQGEREIELLQWFSEHARAHDTIKGFHLEEIPPHVPSTRLFRLPAKWAYEFIIRKLDIRKFKNRAGHQYTCLTENDYERIFSRTLGARLVYTAPQRNPYVIRTHYEGSFRLYTSEGKTRGYPAAGHIFAAQKTAQGKALKLEELRISQQAPESLSIQSVRDEKTGEIVDVVSRNIPQAHIIPYFIGDNGRINVILRADADKGIANLAPRGRNNLDGKRWSGHMVSSPTLTAEQLEGFDHASLAAVARLVKQHFGLTPLHGKGFEEGPKGFPSPAMIDERLETLYINVQKPEIGNLRISGPYEQLRLKVYDAEDILRATGCGFVPDAWLDIQMQDLLTRHGHKPTPWLHEAVPLSYEPPPEDQMLRAGKILRQKKKVPEKPVGPMYTMGNRNTKWPKVAGAFRPIRGSTGQVTAQRSTFVEQGRVDNIVRRTSAHDLDFACPEPNMMNIAAILPLTEDLQGNTLIGFEFKELPVPSRFGQEAPMMNLPTLPLPNSITNIDEARAYIAEQFDVELARVAPMGESFFTLVDMMPQRVFPFMLTRYPRRRNIRMRYTNMYDLLDLTDTDFADSILWKWGFAHAQMCCETSQASSWAPRLEARQRVFGKNAAKWESASASWYKTKTDDEQRRKRANAARPRPENK